MNRIIIPLILAASLVAPSTASADYYIAKKRAEQFARFDVTDRYAEVYGIGAPAASCRPQGRSHPERGYIYHRWTCGWGAGVEEGFVGGRY